MWSIFQPNGGSLRDSRLAGDYLECIKPTFLDESWYDYRFLFAPWGCFVIA